MVVFFNLQKEGGSVALTGNQEKFVQGLVAGLSQRQAYMKAYEKSKKWKPETVDKRASELFKNREVLGRYNELKKQREERALFTFDDAINELIWLYNQSKESIMNQDEGYVRQGTSNAMLGALDRLIQLLLLDPIKAKEYEKLVKEIEGDTDQEEQMSERMRKIKELVINEAKT